MLVGGWSYHVTADPRHVQRKACASWRRAASNPRPVKIVLAERRPDGSPDDEKRHRRNAAETAADPYPCILHKSFGQLVAIDGVSIEHQRGESSSSSGDRAAEDHPIAHPGGPGNRDVARSRSSRRAGRPVKSMVFQGDSIFPWMTVWENAAYGLRMRKGPPRPSRRSWALSRPHRPDAVRQATIRISCPAACASVCRSRAPSPTTRRSCRWMSRSRRSTRRTSCCCRRSCCESGRSSGRPWCSSPTASTRR